MLEISRISINGRRKGERGGWKTACKNWRMVQSDVYLIPWRPRWTSLLDGCLQDPTSERIKLNLVSLHGLLQGAISRMRTNKTNRTSYNPWPESSRASKWNAYVTSSDQRLVLQLQARSCLSAFPCAVGDWSGGGSYSFFCYTSMSDERMSALMLL